VKRTAAALLGVLSATAAAGSVYQWVDGNGVVHYDDDSRIGEKLSRADVANRYIAVDPRATAPAEWVREVEALCRDLKDRSRSYEQAVALYGRDPFGNTYRMSDTQARLERAWLARESGRYCRAGAAEKLLAEARAARQAREPAGTAASAQP
jgi:Domain of unknown function (DUF4124)